MSLVPPSAIICAVRYARPGRSAGSAADPVVNTMRKVTSGDLPGSVTVRICAAAEDTKSRSQPRNSAPASGRWQAEACPTNAAKPPAFGGAGGIARELHESILPLISHLLGRSE